MLVVHTEIHSSGGKLKYLTIEISVLSPLREILDIQEIETGRHDLYTVRGFHRGLLLPQVASKHRWGRLTFLAETCYKACIPSQAWQEKGTRVLSFLPRSSVKMTENAPWPSGKKLKNILTNQDIKISIHFLCIQ